MLAEQLRAVGFEVWLDQTRENDGSPRVHDFATWAERCISEAHRLLIVWTKTYSQRYYDKSLDGEGNGVFWEADLIRQRKYLGPRGDHSYGIILYDESDIKSIPLVFGTTPQYFPRRRESFERLLQWLRSEPPDSTPALREQVRWNVATPDTQTESIPHTESPVSRLPLNPGRELEVEIAIPSGATKDDILLAVKQLAINLDLEFRKLGGSGLKIDFVEIEAAAETEVQHD